MNSYWFIVLFFCSGLNPIRILLGGLIPPTIYEQLFVFVATVMVPLFLMRSRESSHGRFALAIALILGIVVLREIQDELVPRASSIGFYRLHAVFGLYYAVYYVLRKNRAELGSDRFLDRFLIVSAVGSVVSGLFLAFPSLLDYTGGTLKAEDLMSDVGSSFVRLRSNYYVFCQLAIVIVLCRLGSSKFFSLKTLGLLLLLLANFAAVFISGYRANMIMSALLLGAYAARSIVIERKTQTLALSVLVGIPIVGLVYMYTSQRDIETVSESGEESSIVYRALEAGMGIAKLDETNGWLLGVGYADGFVNPLAPDGQQETVLLHNGYVSILYNYGIVGALGWSFLIIGVLKMIVTNARLLWQNVYGYLLAVFLAQLLILNFFQGIFNRGIEPLVCFILAVALLERLVETLVVSKQTVSPEWNS